MTTFRSLLPLLLLAALAAAAVVQSVVDGHNNAMADVFDALDQDELLMDSETHRRMLGMRRGYISYGALGRNRVPCNQRGYSYYNCNSRQRANPYTRGCTRATHCARSSH